MYESKAWFKVLPKAVQKEKLFSRWSEKILIWCFVITFWYQIRSYCPCHMYPNNNLCTFSVLFLMYHSDANKWLDKFIRHFFYKGSILPPAKLTCLLKVFFFIEWFRIVFGGNFVLHDLKTRQIQWTSDNWTSLDFRPSMCPKVEWTGWSTTWTCHWKGYTS
jgi:hypothetical protein